MLVMTNRDVALIAYKILGLWLLALAVITAARAPTIWTWGTDPEEGRTFMALVTLLPAVTTFGVGYAVWFGARWLATVMFPGEALAPLKLDRIETGPLFGLAMSIIGLQLASGAIPGVVNSIALFMQSRHVGATFVGSADPDTQLALWSAAAKANMAAEWTSLLLGIAFLLGPARLAVVATRVRREFSSAGEAGNGSEEPTSADHGDEQSDTVGRGGGTEPRDRG
jgi:hypothetical protein